MGCYPLSLGLLGFGPLVKVNFQELTACFLASTHTWGGIQSASKYSKFAVFIK